MCVHDILFILFIYQQINLMNKTIFNKRASLKFSHFSNKGYSLFSVLGRVVAIGALSVTTLTYAKAEGISVEGAKADSVFIRGGKAYELDGVTVTGSRADDSRVVSKNCDGHDPRGHSAVGGTNNQRRF